MVSIRAALAAKPTFEQPAAEQPPQKQSMHEPTAQTARNKAAPAKPSHEQSPKGSVVVLVVVLVVFLLLVLLTEHTSDARLEGCLESGVNLLNLLLAGQLCTLLLREFLALPGLVDLLELDDLARRGADCHHQLDPLGRAGRHGSRLEAGDSLSLGLSVGFGHLRCLLSLRDSLNSMY